MAFGHPLQLQLLCGHKKAVVRKLLRKEKEKTLRSPHISHKVCQFPLPMAEAVPTLPKLTRDSQHTENYWFCLFFGFEECSLKHSGYVSLGKTESKSFYTPLPHPDLAGAFLDTTLSCFFKNGFLISIYLAYRTVIGKIFKAPGLQTRSKSHQNRYYINTQ